MVIYHSQKEKLPPVFEPFWNSFHFSIKCALLPTRGWTIKKVLNTATPWGGSFYLKVSLICPYWFYALAFLSVFSFFCRCPDGCDAGADTRDPWRHSGLHMSGYAPAQPPPVNTPLKTKNWNTKIQKNAKTEIQKDNKLEHKKTISLATHLSKRHKRHKKLK